ncbi:MAG: hypothetical protein ACPF9W_02860, partial [Nocardioides sp.]
QQSVDFFWPFLLCPMAYAVKNVAFHLGCKHTHQPHRITNMHDEILVIIEVQLGAYTGEDDICRLEDDYGRAPATV